MARSVEFNTVLLAALAVLLVGSEGFADEVRKWRDAQGNLHYSVTGSPDAPSDAKDGPILEGRDATPEESFSVGASLRRRAQQAGEEGRSLGARRGLLSREGDRAQATVALRLVPSVFPVLVVVRILPLR